METEKRKRPGNNESEGRSTRAREEKREETAMEEEVEEFFAILRRIHDGVRYLEKGNGEERKVGEKVGEKWKPTFEWEDFDEGNGGGVKGRENQKRDHEAMEEGNVGLDLDLNAEPV